MAKTTNKQARHMMTGGGGSPLGLFSSYPLSLIPEKSKNMYDIQRAQRNAFKTIFEITGTSYQEFLEGKKNRVRNYSIPYMTRLLNQNIKKYYLQYLAVL